MVSLQGNPNSSNVISVSQIDGENNVVSISLRQALSQIEGNVLAGANNLSTNYYNKTNIDSQNATAASSVSNLTSNLSTNYYNKSSIDSQNATAAISVSNLTSNLANNYYNKASIDSQIASGNNDQASASTVSALSNSLSTNYYSKATSDTILTTGLSGKASLTGFSNLNGSVTSLISGLSSSSIIGTTQLINYNTKITDTSQLLLKMDLSGGDFSNSVGFLGNSYIQLGKDNSTRQSDAGRIGYMLYSTGLDIVGAGSVIGSRMIKIHDHVVIPESVSVGNNTSLTVIDNSGICIPQGKALSFSHGSQLINIGYGNITATELYRLKGVTSPIQEQLDGKMNMLGDIFEVTSVSNFRNQTNTIGLLNVVGDLNLQSNLKVHINSIITPLNLSYLQNLGQNVESSLNSKANSSSVTSQLALKADLSYVNTQLAPCLKSVGGGYDITGPCEFYQNVFFDGAVFLSGVTNLNSGLNLNSNIAAGGVTISPTTFSYVGSATSNLQS